MRTDSPTEPASKPPQSYHIEIADESENEKVRYHPMAKRISDETGREAGARNWGRLALAVIPYALGLGALSWLTVWITAHDFRHQLTQEDRAAAYVGATIRPKGKLAIHMQPHDCTTVVRSDIDGDKLLLYARNDCHHHLGYMAWRWQELSPDGTVLKQGYTNGCPIPEAGETAECQQRIGDLPGWDDRLDDRTDVIRVWTSKDTD